MTLGVVTVYFLCLMIGFILGIVCAVLTEERGIGQYDDDP